jgi:phosphatidylinositol alpha-1,6-mannosyltransferase
LIANKKLASKRILFFATEIFANGGIQRFNQTILAAFSGIDVTCRVLSLHDSPASIPRLMPYANVTVTGFSGNRQRFALAAAVTLWRRRNDWVLIGHINFLWLVVATLALKFFTRDTPIALFAHGIEIWTGIGRLRRYALSRTQRILCVSRYTRQCILDQARQLNPERLTVFPNALSETWRATVRADSTCALPDHFILSVTRLHRGDRYKGIVTVIEALSMLADTSMHYCIIGDGNDVPFLQDVAARCAVHHRVHFLRRVGDAELIAIYERCAAFVLPSGKEGFGIVYLEAMYFGAPVIAAAEKGVLDVIRDGETGLLVRFGDSIAVKDAIERIEKNPVLREHLRTEGKATVNDEGPFTFARFAARFSELLERETQAA